MSDLNKAQIVCKINYCNGEFELTKTLEETEMIGDTLFEFLMRELSDQEDCDTLATACYRMDQVVDQVTEVRDAMQTAYVKELKNES